MKKNIKKLDNLGLETIFNQYKKLVIDVFKVNYTLEFVKKYRHRRNNTFCEVTHVALENFYLLLLWKLFDKKRSKMSVYDVIQNQEFKNFFDSEIKKIEDEKKALNDWRNRVVCHYDITVHFDFKHFESKFKTRDRKKDMKKIESFLFKFLCQLASACNPNHIKPIEKVYKEILDEIKEDCLRETN